MRHLKQGKRLGRTSAHKRALLRNLATSLFRHGKITTTSAKAKELISYAERLISKAKGGSLHERRQILAEIKDKRIVKRLFDEILPKCRERSGGWLRAIRKGPRRGDAAEMSIVELVD